MLRSESLVLSGNCALFHEARTRVMWGKGIEQAEEVTRSQAISVETVLSAPQDTGSSC